MSNRGKKQSLETRGRISKSQIGRIPWNKGLKGYNKDYPRSREWCKNISLANKGKPRPICRGVSYHNWKGGISFTKRDLGNLEYIKWRLAVFERDGFICQMPNCKSKGRDLESHHIKSWAKFPKLRFIIENGITLCKGCHRKTKSKEEIFENLFQEIVFLVNYTRT